MRTLLAVAIAVAAVACADEAERPVAPALDARAGDDGDDDDRGGRRYAVGGIVYRAPRVAPAGDSLGGLTPVRGATVELCWVGPLSRDSVPRDSVPRDSVPRDSVPRDSVPRDSADSARATSVRLAVLAARAAQSDDDDDVGGRRCRRTRTDRRGGYRFERVPAGVYGLTVVDPATDRRYGPSLAIVDRDWDRVASVLPFRR